MFRRILTRGLTSCLLEKRNHRIPKCTRAKHGQQLQSDLKRFQRTWSNSSWYVGNTYRAYDFCGWFYNFQLCSFYITCTGTYQITDEEVNNSRNVWDLLNKDSTITTLFLSCFTLSGVGYCSSYSRTNFSRCFLFCTFLLATEFSHVFLERPLSFSLSSWPAIPSLRVCYYSTSSNDQTTWVVVYVFSSILVQLSVLVSSLRFLPCLFS